LDCEFFLDAVFQNIEQIATLFRDYKIFIALDKGVDKSLEICKRWQTRLPNMKLLVDERQSAERTTNLVLARNRILDEMRRVYSSSEFMIMMDMDDVCSKPIRLSVLRDALLSDHPWDAVTFPGLNSYYDTWAVACYPFLLSYLHFENQDRALLELKKFILGKLSERQWIPCRSAFGGFGLYRVHPYIFCRYANSFKQNLQFLSPLEIQANEGANNSRLFARNDFDCEHRFFHLSAHAKYKTRLFIYPYSLFDHVDSYTFPRAM
jgi:hypothetical protein